MEGGNELERDVYIVAGADGGGVWAAGAVVSREEAGGGGDFGHCVHADGDCGVYFAGGGPGDGDVGGDFSGKLLLSLG